MRPYLSLIIPYHNSESTIGNLLLSIARSERAPSYEVIVVDDGSESKFEIHTKKKRVRAKIGSDIDNRYTRNQKVKPEYNLPKHFPIHVIRIEKNKGPAAARNRGVKAARGKFVVFLDSDVELFHDTLHNLARIFISDPDVVALTGVWVKEQNTKKFFPNFKALRDWSYWINERDKSGYYFLFSTRIAAIKKSVFLRLRGFDESYPGALVEDIELTYRIARRYAIIFAPDVRVRHEFEDFWPIAKKYFLRAYYWTNLYAKRKRFDPVATTFQEAVTALTGASTVGTGVFFMLSAGIILLGLAHQGFRSAAMILTASPYFLLLNTLFLLSFVIHFLLIRKFLYFMYTQKGVVFAAKGFVTGLVLYCFITAGAVWGKVQRR